MSRAQKPILALAIAAHLSLGLAAAQSLDCEGYVSPLPDYLGACRWIPRDWTVANSECFARGMSLQIASPQFSEYGDEPCELVDWFWATWAMMTSVSLLNETPETVVLRADRALGTLAAAPPLIVSDPEFGLRFLRAEALARLGQQDAGAEDARLFLDWYDGGRALLLSTLADVEGVPEEEMHQRFLSLADLYDGWL